MLKQLAQTRADDPFPLYGLAMEHRRLNDVDAAVETFKTLTERFPDYVPTYLMFGQVLTDEGRTAEAVSVLDQGIAVAMRVGDHHAWGELKSAREALGEP